MPRLKLLLSLPPPDFERSYPHSSSKHGDNFLGQNNPLPLEKATAHPALGEALQEALELEASELMLG